MQQDDFKKHFTRATTEVVVDEWGGQKVTLSALTVGEDREVRAKLVKLSLSNVKDDKEEGIAASMTPEQIAMVRNMNLTILHYAWRDDDGKPMFSVEEFDAMPTKTDGTDDNTLALERLINAAYDFNGFAAKTTDKEAKK